MLLRFPPSVLRLLCPSHYYRPRNSQPSMSYLHFRQPVDTAFGVFFVSLECRVSLIHDLPTRFQPFMASGSAAVLSQLPSGSRDRQKQECSEQVKFGRDAELVIFALLRRRANFSGPRELGAHYCSQLTLPENLKSAI